MHVNRGQRSFNDRFSSVSHLTVECYMTPERLCRRHPRWHDAAFIVQVNEHTTGVPTRPQGESYFSDLVYFGMPNCADARKYH